MRALRNEGSLSISSLMQNEKLTMVGSVAAAIAASICCVGPLIAVMLGVGSLSAASKLQEWRPLLLGVTFVLLALAWHLTYRKPNAEACRQRGACATRSGTKGGKVILWITTILAVALAAVPLYAGAVAWFLHPEGARSARSAGARASTLAVKIPSMDCAACAMNIQRRLMKEAGIARAEVVFRTKEAVIEYDSARISADKIAAVIDEAGFKAERLYGEREPMKKTLLIVSAWLLLWQSAVTAGNVETTKGKASKKDVSVYRVPWRCPAAQQIGCGSHAKPILLQLERNPSVSEAWLNRQGTAVAVVWKPDAKRKARQSAEKTLKEENASKLSGEAQTKALADFESGKGWYRGDEVDRLSEEEAEVIAARWVRRVQAKTTLTEEKAEGLRGALTEALKQCLTGEAAMPETAEEKARELGRIARPFLDEKQMQILSEAAGCGMRAMPNEE